ncbi:MAG: tyrosine--tRNA ligase [Thermoplasmata archaeon]
MDLEARAELIGRNTEEVLTPEELGSLLEREPRPRAYIGFEPSGRLTIGHMVLARKMRELQEAGCALTVFLADWHAWINDKLGGDRGRIEAAGQYMKEAFIALGVDGEAVQWRWAHELVATPQYWERVLTIAKGSSLARTKRAMTVLGRSEEESNLDTAKLFYPAMQAADIFELPVDIAVAGLDQRRAHVLAREAAHAARWPVPVAVHTPLISSLRGGGRMDPTAGALEHKMSKSDPTSAILLPSPRALIEERIRAAFCPAREVEGNPVVEIARYILFPSLGRLTVSRAERFGGPLLLERLPEFLDLWRSGGLHPQDLKNAVGPALADLAAPVESHFARRPGSLDRLLETGGAAPQG